MNRLKIRLDMMKDISTFLKCTMGAKGDVILTNGKDFTVNLIEVPLLQMGDDTV